MRFAIAAAVFAAFPLAAIAAPVTIPADAVVMPDTPSGTGDPNTIVCRAPQKLADSDQFGPKRCGYNFEWWQLTTHGKDLAADGTTVVDRPMVARPTGEGNPDAVTCREPEPLNQRGMLAHQVHTRGPEVCQTNRFWADLIVNNKIVDARGTVSAAPRWSAAPGGSDYDNPLGQYYVGSK